MTHQFKSPLGRDLFALGASALPNPDPLKELTDAERYNFGHLQHFDTKPCFLANASPKDIEDELGRLDRPKFKGTPKEL